MRANGTRAAASPGAGGTRLGGAVRRHPVRRAVLGAAVLTTFVSVPGFLVGGMAVFLRREFGLSPAGIGALVVASFAVSAVAALPAGGVVERLGARRGAVLGAALAAVALFGCALAPGPAWLALALVPGGAANALGQLASNAALAQVVPAGRQGVAYGLKQAAIPGATLVAGLSVPLIAVEFGWRWAFAVVGVGGLAAVLPLLPPRASGHVGAGRPAGTVPPASRRPLALVGVSVLLAAFGASSLGTFTVDSAVAAGIGEGTAGLILAGGSLVCVAARVGNGVLADRSGRGRLPVVAGQLVVGGVGLGTLAVAVATGTPWLVPFGVAVGFGLGWSWPGLVNLTVVRTHPEAPAAATSVTQTGVYAGAALGPLAVGAMASGHGYPAAWLLAASALAVAATGLTWAGHRPPFNGDARA